VLGVALRVVLDASVEAGDVARRVDAPAARVDRLAVLVDAVAEDVERRTVPDDERALERQDAAREVDEAPEARELVVLDDVAVPAFLGEEVVDEGLGLQRDRVVDRRRHDVDAPLRLAGLEVPLVRGERRRKEAELELLLDGARARARAAGEEERVVAALEEHL